MEGFMICQNKEVLQQSNVVTRVISFANDGLLEHAHYYISSTEIARETYDHSGVLIDRSGTVPDSTVKEYYGNGALKKIVPYKNGSSHGRGIEYYPSGEVFEEHHYCYGLLHGHSKIYRRDGLLWIDEIYQNGRLHGVSTHYHDNGNPEIRTQYKNGNLNGTYIKYDRYGCLQERGIFNEGKREGKYILYHETGQTERIERYVEGELIFCEEFDEDGNRIATTKPKE